MAAHPSPTCAVWGSFAILRRGRMNQINWLEGAFGLFERVVTTLGIFLGIAAVL